MSYWLRYNHACRCSERKLTTFNGMIMTKIISIRRSNRQLGNTLNCGKYLKVLGRELKMTENVWVILRITLRFYVTNVWKIWLRPVLWWCPAIVSVLGMNTLSFIIFKVRQFFLNINVIFKGKHCTLFPLFLLMFNNRIYGFVKIINRVFVRALWMEKIVNVLIFSVMVCFHLCVVVRKWMKISFSKQVISWGDLEI